MSIAIPMRSAMDIEPIRNDEHRRSARSTPAGARPKGGIVSRTGRYGGIPGAVEPPRR